MPVSEERDMDHMKEELTIRVILTQINEVKSENSLARMILFEGDCDCENFKGKILAGGVDTQQERDGEPLVLSARYMLEGTDREGKACRIFIENVGVAGEKGTAETKPYICTDSEALKYLCKSELYGTIEPWEKGVFIHIFSR